MNRAEYEFLRWKLTEAQRHIEAARECLAAAAVSVPEGSALEKCVSDMRHLLHADDVACASGDDQAWSFGNAKDDLEALWKAAQ